MLVFGIRSIFNHTACAGINHEDREEDGTLYKIAKKKDFRDLFFVSLPFWMPASRTSWLRPVFPLVREVH
jgi:hypothetical protein